MSVMDWITLLIAAIGGVGGAALAHGMARGQISALNKECGHLWDELRSLRDRQDRHLNGNGTNHD